MEFENKRKETGSTHFFQGQKNHYSQFTCVLVAGGKAKNGIPTCIGNVKL